MVRYLIKYSKENGIKFISHLDLMRTIQRMVRRSGLPVDYSKGFNPHMAISIAQPLSVGMHSEGEYMDVVLKEQVAEEEIKARLNENAPVGIVIKEVCIVVQKENDKKIPQAMAFIDEAKYSIEIRYNDVDRLEDEMEALLKKPQWDTIKKSKSGEKEVDIKPMVKKLKYVLDGKVLKIETTISCGSRENLSAQLLSEYIRNNTNGGDLDLFVDIRRIEMYAYKGNEVVPLYKYI